MRRWLIPKTPGNPSPDNRLIEVADVTVTDDPGLNAILVQVITPTGAGFSFLIAPEQTCDLIAKLITALDRLRGWTPAGPLSSTI